MIREDDGSDEPLAAGSGLAVGFTEDSLKLRLEFQRKCAAALLERLCEIAMNEQRGAIQVSAIRELLDQILGRPMPPAAIPAKLEEDTLAALEAMGAGLREKLDRMADRDRSGRAGEAEQ